MKLLPHIQSPVDLKHLSLAELNTLAAEMRETLCNLLSTRSAHFASNLGVVELCLALHSTYDFRRDRLVWDTGHQIYPHKLITGRFENFGTIRTRGGLMGYPNPEESDYDLFVTGHAGCSVSSVSGLQSGDALLGEPDRHHVAVIGDGAFPSGIVHEAMNNIGGMRQKMLVILNDNEMSICPRVGGLADYLDRLRGNPLYTGLKAEVVRMLNQVPLLGDPVERMLAQIKEGVKAGLHGGMLFEELGFRYLGPIDGHNIALLRKYFEMIREMDDPVLLHVVTRKGEGFEPATEDPVFFHAPPAFERQGDQAVPKKKGGEKAYTHYARDAVHKAMGEDRRVTVLTAAMCQGNKLDPVRDSYPDRFFDTGICESHTVAFAAGQAKAGMRPIVSIYSTFLQRSFDQIFQEVALQNLPVTFMLDRAGLAGPDGPTHHGVFDLPYMRIFPNMVVMAPGDAHDVGAMLDFALAHNGPISMRYPKAIAEPIEREPAPIELGKAEVLRTGRDGVILSCGALTGDCLQVADDLAAVGVDVGVVNARFVKPLDVETIVPLVRDGKIVVTVEEGVLAGGFGAAVLEACADEGIDASHVRRLGIPDRFIEHGDRDGLLGELSLDVAGVARTCQEAALEAGVVESFAEEMQYSSGEGESRS